MGASGSEAHASAASDVLRLLHVVSAVVVCDPIPASGPGNDDGGADFGAASPEGDEAPESDDGEARRLIHPGIARVYEFHRTAERAFLTMEFVDGQDIGTLRRRPLEEILPVVRSIAAALAYAHSRGVWSTVTSRSPTCYGMPTARPG